MTGRMHKSTDRETPHRSRKAESLQQSADVPAPDHQFLTAEKILHLQRTIGNQKTLSILNRRPHAHTVQARGHAIAIQRTWPSDMLLDIEENTAVPSVAEPDANSILDEENPEVDEMKKEQQPLKPQPAPKGRYKHLVSLAEDYKFEGTDFSNIELFYDHLDLPRYVEDTIKARVNHRETEWSSLGSAATQKQQAVTKEETLQVLKEYYSHPDNMVPPNVSVRIKKVQDADLPSFELKTKSPQEMSPQEAAAFENETGQAQKELDSVVFIWRGKPFITSQMEALKSGEEGRAIFVMTDDGKIYAADQKIEAVDPRGWRDSTWDAFHHSSFLRGKAVAAAGELIFNNEGRLTGVTNSSGHYQPEVHHTVQVLQELAQRGVSLSHVEVELFLNVEEEDFHDKLTFLAADIIGWDGVGAFEFMNWAAKKGLKCKDRKGKFMDLKAYIEAKYVNKKPNEVVTEDENAVLGELDPHRH